MDGYRFDTLAEAPAERVFAWRTVNRRFFGDLSVEALSTHSMDARMHARDVGRLHMFHIDAPPHRVGRHDTRGDWPIDDYYKLVLQLAGRAEIRQGNRRFDLRPGSWSLYDPRIPYSITNFEPARLFVLQIPRDELAGLRVPGLHTCEAQTSGLAGLYAVFGGFLGSLADQLEVLPAEVGGQVSDAVLSLLGATITGAEMQACATRALPDMLRKRLKHFIVMHLADDDLGLDRLAGELRCSKRYLHRVFEAEELSIEQFIWHKRLERCHEALSTLPSARRSVSEIAFGWGFNSSAHFSRLFRARYGSTPSDLRRATLAGGSGGHASSWVIAPSGRASRAPRARYR